MTSLSMPARSLIDPVDGVAAAVEGRRWLAPLLVVMACVSLSAAALYLRWDPSPRVVAELASSGELTRLTEQDLADKVTTTGRIALVTGVARGLVLMPLFALVLAVALKLTGWLGGLKADFGKCFTAAAVALLPIALYHLVYVACTLRQLAVTDAQLATLVPSSLGVLFPKVAPKLGRVLSAVDFFNLWSAGLLGLGFAGATGTGRGRGVLVGFVLYALFAAAFLIGLPGMGGGGK